MTLPTPGQSFAWHEIEGRAALMCRPLEPFAPHLFTTSSWRLGSRAVSTDDGWSEVAQALGSDAACLVRARQVHGVDVIVGPGAAPDGSLPPADIILAHQASAIAAVQVADCLPLLVVDPVTGAVAAVHAGWRGLAARAPEVAIAALTRTFGTRPADLLIALGPSIGVCCYEVGTEVRESFERAGFSDAQLRRWFQPHPAVDPNNPTWSAVRTRSRRPEHWFFDGWAAAREQIVAAGVPTDQVFSSALCTASHPEVFCSYRRDGSPAGRIVGAIRCRDAE